MQQTTVDTYPSRPLSTIKEKPVAIASFNEPIFKLGEFQDHYVQVDVEVYPLTYENVNGKMLVGIRFGEMNLVRFIDKDLLFNMRPLDSEE